VIRAYRRAKSTPLQRVSEAPAARSENVCSDEYRYDYARVMRVFKRERVQYVIDSIVSTRRLASSSFVSFRMAFFIALSSLPRSFSLSFLSSQHSCCVADRISNCAFKFPLHMLRKMSTVRKPVQRITMRIFRRRVLSATNRSIVVHFSPQYSWFFFPRYPLSSYLQLYDH